MGYAINALILLCFLFDECYFIFFFFQAEDGIRDKLVTGVQTCALPIWLEGLTPVPWDAAPPGVTDLFVQVPILLTQELQTTVTVPDGGTLLLGGFVEGTSGLPHTRPASQPATRAVSDLYMLVKPTLIVQREREPKQFPLLSTRPAK